MDTIADFFIALGYLSVFFVCLFVLVALEERANKVKLCEQPRRN